MSKTDDKTKSEQARPSEIKGVENFQEFTFPEHGVTIRAVDMPSAIKILEKRLKGSIYGKI